MRDIATLEKAFSATLDHGILIGLASQIVETELDRLLATPALAIAPSLIQALSQKKKDREPAEILESWAAKKTWTVLGIESILLLASTPWCDQGIPAIQAFLENHFTSDYLVLVRSKSLGQALDQVRNRAATTSSIAGSHSTLSHTRSSSRVCSGIAGSDSGKMKGPCLHPLGLDLLFSITISHTRGLPPHLRKNSRVCCLNDQNLRPMTRRSRSYSR